MKIPNPKSQVPRKLQIPSSNNAACGDQYLELGAWDFGLAKAFGVGIWDLEFGIWNFSYGILDFMTSDIRFGLRMLAKTPGVTTTFILVPVFLSLIALFASYLPARRAAKLDPV